MNKHSTCLTKSLQQINLLRHLWQPVRKEKQNRTTCSHITRKKKYHTPHDVCGKYFFLNKYQPDYDFIAHIHMASFFFLAFMTLINNLFQQLDFVSGSSDGEFIYIKFTTYRDNTVHLCYIHSLTVVRLNDS